MGLCEQSRGLVLKILPAHCCMHNTAKYIRKHCNSHEFEIISAVMVQLVIEAAPNDQVLMAALLHDPAVFKNQNAVRLLHRGQAVSNDERGAAGQKPAERLMQPPFGIGVER
jgi:hypothetical protein